MAYGGRDLTSLQEGDYCIQKVIFWYTSTKEVEEHNILVWIDQNSIDQILIFLMRMTKNCFQIFSHATLQ